MAIATSEPQIVQNRLHGLDYLRGLAALGIMIYHYSSWSFGEQDASSFLGKVGIYGVAIFYILSGQTLAYVYSAALQPNWISAGDFYRKRVLRIFPLLWAATLISIALSKRIPNIPDVVLNLTGLFSLFSWDKYFATGAWSIGNELAFYVAFPTVLFLTYQNRVINLLLAIGALALFMYFSFGALQPEIALGSQWRIYTNPLNQFSFFLSGVFIGRFISPSKIKASLSLIAGVVGLALFVLIPAGGGAIQLVTGWHRVLFATSCILICLSFFRTASARAIIDKPLALLGQISYSLYLLHPIIYNIIKPVLALLIPNKYAGLTALTLLASTLASLTLSFLSYHYFERPFIRLSHKPMPSQ
jgi:peptidoglycan/LPS O-acetylase OafA/YrhL